MEYYQTMSSSLSQPASGGRERETGRPPTSYQPKIIIKNDRVAKVGKTEHIWLVDLLLYCIAIASLDDDG